MDDVRSDGNIAQTNLSINDEPISISMAKVEKVPNQALTQRNADQTWKVSFYCRAVAVSLLSIVFVTILAECDFYKIVKLASCWLDSAWIRWL